MILQHASFSADLIGQIEQNVSGATLVSYILYVFGSEKDSFNAPWRFIRSRLTGEMPDIPIPGKVSYLSKLTPRQLSCLMRETDTNWAGTLELADESLSGAEVWKQYLRSIESIHTIYEMAEILGLAGWSRE